jgi:hypothetical protein
VPACNVPPSRALQFEKQFENLDVQSEFVEQAMQNQAVLSTPEDDVNLLVQQVGAQGCVRGAWVGWPAAADGCCIKGRSRQAGG